VPDTHRLAGAPVEEAHVIGSKIEFKAKRVKGGKAAKGKAKPAGKASMLTFDEDNEDES